MKKCKLFSIILSFFTIFSLFLASCDSVEIGLGSAVDTEAAKLSVDETPKAGDVVRDSFKLSGICTDDTEIKSFKIIFQDTTGAEGKIEFSTTPDRLTGRWELIVDPNQVDEETGEKLIPDGEYQVTFQVIDKVKHETIVTRQFRIDNTPPVLIIERPSSKSNATENSIDSYGQAFTLEGQSADDNDVKSIEVIIYDDIPDPEKEEVLTPKVIILNNVPSRINMDIAKFEEGKDNDYSDIYGSKTRAGSTTKKLYFELVAYDSAVRYPIDGSDQREEDLKGNKSDFYYLHSDVSTDILSKYKITDVYHILSGTYKETGFGKDYVKSYLSRAEKKTAIGSFSLNPENSPTFTIMGRSQLKSEVPLFGKGDEYSDYKATNSTTIPIEVQPGLDSIPLLTEENCKDYVGYAELYLNDPENNSDYASYEKYLNPPYSEIDEETGERKIIYKFRPYFVECDDNGNELENTDIIYPSQVSKKVSGLNHQFTITLQKDDGFQYNHNYKIFVEGLDESRNSIMSTGTGYGFRFVSSGMPPAIEITEPKEPLTRLKLGDSIKFSGKISTEDGIPDLVFYLKNDSVEGTSEGEEEKTEIFRKAYTVDDALINEKTKLLEYYFDETIPADKFDQDQSTQYTIIVSAEDEKTSEETKNILYDVEGPNINITDKKPVVDNGERNNNINKTITVRGNLDDAFDSVASAEWKLTQKDDDEKDVTILSGSGLTTVFKIEVDTTKAQDKKEATLTITAKDKAGNQSEISEYFFIDQATDIPTISPSDLDTLTFEYSDKAKLIAGNKSVTKDNAKNVYTANSQVLMFFTDDDGIESITINATPYPDNYGGGEAEPTTTTVQVKNATEYTYPCKAPVYEGYYTIEVIVKDCTGVEKSESFCILVSGAVPEVKITTTPEFVTTNTENVSPDEKKTKKSFTVKGTNSGTTPFQSVERDGVPLAETVYSGYEGDNTNMRVKWTDIFTPPKPAESTGNNSSVNSGKVVYKVYDAYETGSEEVTFTYSLDNIHPTAVITSCLDPSTSQGASFRFIGTAADNEDGSGVAEVQVRIDNLETGRTSASTWNELDAIDSSADSIASTGWINASGTDNWNCQIVFDDYKAVFGNGKEGKKVLYVRATDVVGNYNKMTKQEFVYDKADPVLTVDESSFQRFMGSGGYTLTGSASDTNALKEVVISETKTVTDSTEPVTVTSVVTVGPDGKWAVQVPLGNAEPESGTYKYVVVAEDVAGNKTSSNEYQTVVDISPPQLRIDRPVENSVGTGAINETRSNFNGGVSDTSGVKYVWYKILARGSTTPIVPESSSQALLEETWNGWNLANTGTTVWDFDQTFRAGNTAETTGSLREGKWTLYITAVDNAGMVSNLLTRDFDVDMGFPTLTESSASEFQTREGFTLNGFASDTNELTSIRITDEEADDISITVAPNANGSWSQVFKVSGEEVDEDSILLADGTHTLMIRATDVQGKITALSRTVIVDTTAPLLEILTPATDTERTETNSIAEISFKFDGLLTETNTGVQNVWYKIVSSTDAAPVGPVAGENALTAANWTGWTKATSGNTLWSATQRFKTKGTGTTQTGTSASNEIEEGSWKLYIYAVDKVGNVSSAGTRTFSVDMSAPAITTCEITNGNGTNCINIGGLTDGTYYFKSNLSGKVLATDSYAMAPENEAAGTYPLSVQIDGTDTIVVPNTNSADNSNLGEWTIPSSAFTEGTKQTVTMTATDIVGKTTTRTFNVCYDVTAPVVEIEYPADGTNVTIGSVEARGTITERASGINKLQYTLVENPAESDWHDINCSSNSTNWTQNFEFDTEGNVVLKVRAIDNLGNQAAEPKTVSFIYDCTAPTLNVVELSQYKKEDFTLSGTAWDSNAVNKIEIKDDGNNKTWTYNFTAEQKAAAKDSAHAVNWSFDFVTGLSNSGEENYLTDGSHTLIITLTDVAGRTTTNSKTVFIDKSNPQIVSAVTPAATLTEGASFRFTGVAKDYFGGTENAARDSGLSKVEIQIVNKNTEPTNGSETEDATGWIEVTGLEAWSATVVFASYDVFDTENKKTLCVRATDTVGNVSEIFTQDFDYDKARPTLSVVSYTPTAEGSSALSLNQVDLIPLFEVNGNFSLNGMASDSYGINSIVVTQKIGEGEEHTITTINPASSQYIENGNWSVNNLPRNPETITEALTGDEIISGIYTYKVTITDAVGKTSSKTVQAVIDRTAPTVNITTPNSATSNTDLNAISVVSFRFAGTAGDSGDGATGVEKVWYEILAQDGTPTAAPATNTTVDSAWTSHGFKLASNTTSWFFSQPIISGTTTPSNPTDENYGSICEGKYKLSVYAVDKAGNVSSAASQIFDVDMAAPSLTVGITEAADSCIELNDTFYFKGDLTGTATATDSYRMPENEAITFKVGTTTVTPTWDGANWTIASSAFSETYQVLTITATDYVGKTATVTKNVCKDESAPQVSISKPESNGIIDISPVIARISVIENGVGIQGKTNTVDSKVEYRFNGGTWIPTGYTSGTTVEQELDLGTTQGEMTLQVRATDKLGNTTTTPVTTFYYDYQDPVIEKTDEVARYVNGAFTLEGTAYDTYQLSYIEVKDTTDGNKVYKSNSATNTQIQLYNGETQTNDITTAVTAETAITWKLTFTTADWNGFSEGNHVFKITAYDVSGRSVEAPNKNIWIDKHAPVVTSSVVPTTQQTQSSSFRFSGIAKDYNRNAGTTGSNSLDSGIKIIEVQITNEGVAPGSSTTATATGWIDATGQEDWSAVVAYDDYDVFDTEGVKTLHVRATDEAGFVSETAAKNFVYDKAAPTLVVSTYTPEGGSALAISTTENEPAFNVNGNFVLSGTSSDSNGIKQVVITQKIGDADPVVIETLNGAGATTFNWSTNTGTGKGLPRDPTTNEALTGDNLDSGIYTYTVTVTDVAGNETITEATAKSASKTVKATIDKTAPVVAITNPANENANTGLNAISVVSNRFAGTATDNHEGSTDVGAVWYKIIVNEDDNTVPAAPTASTTVDSTWTGLGFTKASNTTNWFFSQAMNEGTTASDNEHICEGRYKLVVYAVDKAGNVSSAASQVFDVDMSAPEIETLLDGTLLDESMTQTKTGAYAFKYKVTESYGFATGYPQLTIRKDNAKDNEGNPVYTNYTLSEPDANGYITVTIGTEQTPQADGLYEYTIAATDLVGKNYTIRRNILLDTTPPALTVISPELSVWQNAASVTVNGSAEDKSGTFAVWYLFGVDSIPESGEGAIPSSGSSAKADSAWTGGWTKAEGSTSWSISVTGVEGEPKNLFIVAVDENGAVTTGSQIISTVVKVDTSNPNLTENGIGAGTQYKNVGFTLSGTASDNGSGLVATNPVTITGDTNPYYPTVTASTGAWSQSITPASEGTYTYTIKAKDVAGRESTESRTVVYDITAPSITTKTVGNIAADKKAEISGTTWYKTTQIPVVVAGSDNLAGLSLVECSTDWNSTDTENPENGNWTTLNRNSDGNYTGTISCTEQGTNTIYIRATDQAGNKSNPATNTITVHVDTLAPDTFTLGTVDGSELEGVKLVNGQNPLTFTFTASDSGTSTNSCGLAVTDPDENNYAALLTKIGTVDLTQSPNTPIGATLSNGVYSIEIPVEKMPADDVTTPVNVIVTLKDALGTSAEFTAFQLQKDNIYPLATVGTIKDADTSTSGIEVNGIITVSGTSSDTHTITGIKLQYQTSENGTSGWSDWEDYSGSNTTGSNYSWSYTIDTTNAFGDDFDNKFVRFRAIATDQAGNSGNTGTTTQYCEDTAANNKVVKVYQYTDRPVIRFTNLDLSDVDDIWLTRADKIFGLISDDDGDVTSLKYKLSTAGSWTTLTPSAGSGYFEITAPADGENTIYFQVTDAAGKTFETDTSENPVALNEPVLSDGTNKIDGLTEGGTEEGTVALTLKVDQTSPMLQSKQYQIFNKEKGTNGQWGNWVSTNAGEVWTENAWSSALGTLGGRYSGLRVKLEAKDENAITSVTSTFGTGNTVTFDYNQREENETLNDGNYHEWKTGNIAIPETTTEVINLVVTITDGAGLDTKETIPVEIDNSAPIINIQEPSTLIGTTETIKGNITTVNGSETREAKLYYAVSRYDATPNSVKPSDSGTRTRTEAGTGNTIVLATAWEEIKALTTSLNWYVYFDDLEDTDDHTDRFAYYLAEGTQAKPYLGYTTKAAIDNGTFETETQLYFWIKAVDSTGNASVAYTALHVDPQGDRPTVTLSYPADVQNSSGQMVAPTLGGSIRLNGTATDNRYAKYVWVQIEKPNNSGEFDGFDAADLEFMNTSSNGERTYGYELGQISTNSTKTISEIAAVVAANTNISDYGIRVPVTGSSWFVVVNKEGEYSPEENSETNTKIKFTIIATDETEMAAGSTKINKSHAVTQEVLLDSDTPYIDDTQLKLVQYETSEDSGIACTDGTISSGTIINNIPYVNGMSINGIWFLTGKITDDGGISSVKVNGVERVSSAGSSYNDDGIKLTPVAHVNDSTKYDYTFQVPIGNNVEGQVGTDEVRIEAKEVKDQNPLSVDKTFGVTYDNLAPVFITSNNTNVTLPTIVQDSSGFFTFGAVATEDSVGNGQNAVSQSGIERIAFYFTRDLGYNIKNLNATQYSGHETDATVTHDLFDVMISSENRDSDDTTSGNIIIDYASGSVTENEVFVPSSSEMKTNYKYEDHLIWQSVTDCTVSGAGITLPNNSNTKNIHKGGLAKINGAIYRISGVSENIVNIEGEPGDGTVEVLFAIANIIDNNSDRMGSVISSTKGYGYGYYTGNTQDDGDLMIETFNKQQTAWIFDASVKSTNLPDGPITLHIVAMDKAGNVSEYAYNATINNNGPRIAGMFIGTDENGNGEVDDTESYSEFNKTTYHTKYVNGKQGNSKITEATFPTPDQQNEGITTAIKVKGKIKIKPEIIGGNNTLKYTYDVYYRNAQNNGWNETADYSKLAPTNFGTGAQDQAADVQAIVLDVSDFIKPLNEEEETESNPGRIKDGNNHKFVFHISDTTPAWTENGVSQSTPATLNVLMDVDLRDSTPAKNYIIPFYWKDASSNSLFGNSRNNGHIELAKDWVRTGAYSTGSATALFDADPKVSGKIKLEGIAQDNGVLKEITVQLNKAIGGMGTTETTIATYNGGTNSNISANWTLGSSLTEGAIPTQAGDTQGWAAEITQATYGELLAAGIINSIPTGVQATALVPETSQTYGHVVHWTLYIDSAYVENGAATDVIITAKATDKGKPTWNGSAVVYGSNTASVSGSGYSGAVTVTGSGESATVTEGDYSGSYKVDIVPYITSLGTALANLKKNNPSVFARTALGHYPVAITTSAGETTSETITAAGFNLSGGTVTFTPSSGSATVAYNSDGFGIPANAKSGKMSITVNGVESLNNVNNNNARGNYTGTVNLATKPTGDKSVYDNYYNRQPNGDNNNLLTDDIEVDVWEIDTEAVQPMRKQGSIAQAIMKINPVTDQLGFAFANGAAYFSMPGKTIEAANDVNDSSTWNGNNVIKFNALRDYSYTYWNGELEPFTSVGFTYDKYGYSYGVAAGGDINSGTNSGIDFFSFMTDRWGKALGSHNGGDDYQRHKSSKHDQNAVRIETNGIWDNGSALFETKRIKSPTIVVAAHGEDNSSANTNVYLAYFDVLTSQLKFRAGNIGNKLTGVNSNNYSPEAFYTITKLEKSNTMGKNFYTVNENINWNLTEGNRVKIYKEQDGEKVLFSNDEYVIYNLDYSNKKFALLLSDESGTTEPCPLYDSTTSTKLQEGTYYIQAIPEKSKGFFGNFTNTYGNQTKLSDLKEKSTSEEYLSIIAEGTTAGEYISMGIIPKGSTGGLTSDDVLVIVWYGDDLALHYAYNTTPSTIRGNGSTEGWTSSTLFTGDLAQAGEYCQIAVDGNGGIHIAALDSSNSDVIYAYIAKYDEPNNVKTCIVDSNGIVGDNLMIDVALENGKAIPRISYYNSSSKKPKMAYLVDTTEENPEGAKDDLFTGKWEVTVIPTSTTSKIDLSDSGNKINVGLWKNTDGTIKTKDNINTGTKIQSTDHVNNYYSTSYGIKYGNGTPNPIVAYIIKPSSTTNRIETAQMK